MPTTPARWRHLARLGNPHRRAIAAVLVLTVAAGLTGGLEPLVLGRALDAATRGDGPTVSLTFAGWLAVALVAEAVRGTAHWAAWRVRVAISQALVVATVGHVQRLPIAFHRQHRVGEIVTQLDRGTQGLVLAFSELAFQVLPAAVYLLTAAAVMARLEPRLAALVLVLAPIPPIITAIAAPEQVRREREMLQRWTTLYARFHEVLQGMLTVKAYAMEDAERTRFLSGVTALNRRVVEGVARDTRTDVLRNTFVIAARILALAAGAHLALRGEISAGTVLAFSGYVGGLFGPLHNLGSSFQTVRRASVALDTVGALLDAPTEAADGEGIALPRVHGRIELRGVTFAYEPGRPVLDGLDLTVEAGKCVALVGPSGSGKSTVVGLVQRLYDPQQGAVLVDGRDVRSFDPRSWRRQVGVVLQDGVLFDDTVAANIAYGRPEASMDEIVQAARAAWADRFIRALPDGYETRVRERGLLLSAGQRQRIAIARALLTDPPVLVLDEATSALDTEAEFEVQRALRGLVAGRTTIIVAHRLSTVVSADRIVALDGGRVVEEGTHAELLARGGYYANIVGLARVS